MRIHLMLILLLVLTGCGVKNYVILNGSLQPDQQVHYQDLSGKFHTYFSVSRAYNDGEESTGIEYLPLNECVRVPKDTRGVFLNLSIVNPVGWNFRIVKIIEIGGVKKLQREVYFGSVKHKTFQLRAAPTPGKETKVYAEVYMGRSELPLVIAGDACYILPREEVIHKH